MFQPINLVNISKALKHKSHYQNTAFSHKIFFFVLSYWLAFSSLITGEMWFTLLSKTCRHIHKYSSTPTDIIINTGYLHPHKEVFIPTQMNMHTKTDKHGDPCTPFHAMMQKYNKSSCERECILLLYIHTKTKETHAPI